MLVNRTTYYNYGFNSTYWYDYELASAGGVVAACRFQFHLLVRL